MSKRSFDIVIVGGGHNGLVAACYLAKAGLSTLVLERREIIGGSSVTEEIHPGFRCSTLAHAGGPLLSHIAKDLDLARHGLEIIEPDARVTALHPDGQSLTIYNDPKRTADELKKHSSHDSESYLEFAASFARLGRVLAPLIGMTPPTIEKPAVSEVWNLGKVGLSFRKLAKKDAYRLLRWGPMAVADLAAEWFETELLRATVAARGIFGTFAGPWSAGTSTGLLLQTAVDGNAIAPGSFAKGGMGELTRALADAAKAAGAEIRTGIAVESVQVAEGKAKSVCAGGEQIPAQAHYFKCRPALNFSQAD